MRPATLPLLLILALLAVPLAERVWDVVPAVGGSPAISAGANAPMAPIKSREERVGGSRGELARGELTFPVDIAITGARSPAAQTPTDIPLELVTIVPQQYGAPVPAPRPLGRAEALASVMRSPEFEETIPPIARLYFAAFGRYPDYEGLNYYTGVRESGLTLAEIAEDFARGREFDMRYGSLSNAEFVERLFVNVLGDAHQADVRGYWVSQLDSGEMTRGQVIVDLSESGAFRERSSNRVFVSTAYTEIYHATPEPVAYERWVGLLDAGHPRRSFIDGLLAGR